jgi:tRNA pseudouridine38-40 synthase
MQRFFIEMAYDGTNFHGWQIQPNASSVQEVMNDALRKVFRKDIYIVGCGRTDTGVHSDYFVAHFDVDDVQDLDIPHCVFKLNSILPPEVAVYSLQLADSELHSRFSARSRTYFYRLSKVKTPHLRFNHFRPFFQLDFEKMNQAAAELLRFTDFTSFSRLHTETKTNDCNVMYAKWVQQPDGNWYFIIKANRFLRNMVRAIVGTLFDVGRGKITVEQFVEIIEAKDRKRASTSAAACGLSLVDIEYPEGYGFIQHFRKVSI